MILTNSAHISEDGLYRYRLTRNWGRPDVPATKAPVFIMLNPSTADEEKDDPTIRRCIGFVKGMEGWGLEVLNLYPFRATKPSRLWAQEEGVRVGDDTILRDYLRAAARRGTPIIAAWGNLPGKAYPRARAVLDMIPGCPVRCLFAPTKGFHPRHPLYSPGPQHSGWLQHYNKHRYGQVSE